MNNSKIKSIKEKQKKFQFTSLKINAEQLLEKSRALKGNFQGQFMQSIKDEVEQQQELAEKFPDIVLNIKSFDCKTMKNPLKQQKLIAIITYQCDIRCMPVLEYVKQLAGINTLEQKLKICYQLFAIAVWIGQTTNTHRNLKPSNIFYYENQVLLSDFGSKRTFYQNYIADFTKFSHIEWQSEYYFYNTQDFLKILHNAINNELFDWSEMQTLDKLIQSDLWAIGLIILEIFCSKQEINDQIKKDITVDIKEFYGMNQDNLDKALKIFKSKTNQTMYNNLAKLLQFKVNNIELEEIKNSIQQEEEQIIQLSQSFKVLSVNQSINFQLSKQKEVEIIKYTFGTVKDFKQLQISIVNFQDIQLNETINFQNQIRQSVQFNQKIYIPTKEESEIVFQSKKVFFQFTCVLNKQIDLQKFNKSQDININNYFLCYDTLIYLNQNEIEHYKNRLKKIKEFYLTKQLIRLNVKYSTSEQMVKFINNAIQQAEWREQALQIYNNSNQQLLPLIGQLLFYLNIEEFNDLIEKQFFKDFILTQSPDQKLYLEKQIQLKFKIWEQTLYLQIDGDYRFDYEELDYITIRALEQSRNHEKGWTFDLYQEKCQKKKMNGTEILKFNELLGGIIKCMNFLETGEYQYILKSFQEFNKLSPDFQQKYKEKLKNQIQVTDDQQSMEFYRAQFLIFRDLPYLLHPNNQRHQYDIIKLKIQYEFEDLDEKIKQFYEGLISKHLTFQREHHQYLKQLDLIHKEQMNQIIDNQLQSCIYSGFQIENLPNGIGFSKINDQYLQFGIYEKNQLIWGWSIYFRKNYLYCQKGVFEQQGYGNGAIKKFSISYQNNQYTFELKNKRKGRLQNWKLEGRGSKKKVKGGKQILYEGEFASNKLNGEATQYFNKEKTNWQVGRFSEGKPQGRHLQNENDKQTWINYDYCCLIT